MIMMVDVWQVAKYVEILPTIKQRRHAQGKTLTGAQLAE